MGLSLMASIDDWLVNDCGERDNRVSGSIIIFLVVDDF